MDILMQIGPGRQPDQPYLPPSPPPGSGTYDGPSFSQLMEQSSGSSGYPSLQGNEFQTQNSSRESSFSADTGESRRAEEREISHDASSDKGVREERVKPQPAEDEAAASREQTSVSEETEVPAETEAQAETAAQAEAVTEKKDHGSPKKVLDQKISAALAHRETAAAGKIKSSDLASSAQSGKIGKGGSVSGEKTAEAADQAKGQIGTGKPDLSQTLEKVTGGEKSSQAVETSQNRAAEAPSAGAEKKGLDPAHSLKAGEAASQEDSGAKGKSQTAKAAGQSEIEVVDLRRLKEGAAGGESRGQEGADSRQESRNPSLASLAQKEGASVKGEGSASEVKGSFQETFAQEAGRSVKDVVVKMAPGESTTEALSRHMKESLTSDIVKQARFVLKDQGAGEIRLILKPEALGQVKIQMNLQENHIAGRIIVENSSVREAFENNLASLNKALRDSGYETEGLDVQVDQGQDRHHSGDSGERSPQRHVIRNSQSGRLWDQSVPRLRETQGVVHSAVSGLSSVNLMI